MVTKRLSFLAAVTVLAVVLISSAGLSFAEKPTVLAPCNQCHQPEKDLVRGTLVAVMEKFKTINVQVGGKLVWVINYGDDLKITGADKLSSITKEKEIGIKFTGDEKKPYAVSLTVKPPATIAPEKLVSLEEMAKLVAMGTEAGKYLLIDSRPKPRFNEGHIPSALSLPHDKFDQLKDLILPKEKDKLLIFYCGGVT
jgi:hypothetical protein